MKLKNEDVYDLPKRYILALTFLNFFFKKPFFGGENNLPVSFCFLIKYSVTPLLVQQHYIVGRSESFGGPSGTNFRDFRFTYSWEFRNEFLGILERHVGHAGIDWWVLAILPILFPTSGSCVAWLRFIMYKVFPPLFKENDKVFPRRHLPGRTFLRRKIWPPPVIFSKPAPGM